METADYVPYTVMTIALIALVRRGGGGLGFVYTLLFALHFGNKMTKFLNKSTCAVMPWFSFTLSGGLHNHHVSPSSS